MPYRIGQPQGIAPTFNAVFVGCVPRTKLCLEGAWDAPYITRQFILDKVLGSFFGPLDKSRFLGDSNMKKYHLSLFIKILYLCSGLFFTSLSIAEEKIIVSLGDANSGSSVICRLYSMNPDGSQLKPLFSFEQQVASDARILKPRLSSDQQHILFSSDFDKIRTPTSANIFSFNMENKALQQVTPYPNFGVFNNTCPDCGTVTGVVQNSQGLTLSRSLIFLEGIQKIVSSDDNGQFRFDNVPSGAHFIIAYRPDTLSVYASSLLFVSSVGTTNITLTPDQGNKLSIHSPVSFENRLYFILGYELDWLDINGNSREDYYKKVYSSLSNSQCIGIPDIGFDVAPRSGRLLIMDYIDGCPSNRGVYLADKDGNNVQLLLDFKAENSPLHLSGLGENELFWSPDESKIALESTLNPDFFGYDFGAVIAVLDANRGEILSIIPFNKNITTVNLEFHGWSPKGDALLMSSWTDSVETGELVRVPVDAQGIANTEAATSLINGRNICGATWVDVNTSPAPLDKPNIQLNVNDLQVTAGWQAVNGADGYRLYYAPYPNAEQIYHIDLGTQTNLSVTLWPGAAFYVAVKAYNSQGETDYSNIEHFTL